MANQANMNLDSAVRKYVQVYIALKREAGRNLTSANTATINKQFADAMRIYVGKRLAVAVATTAAVTAAGGSQAAAMRAGAAAGAEAGSGSSVQTAAAAAEQVPQNQRRAAAMGAGVANAAIHAGATPQQAAGAAQIAARTVRAPAPVQVITRFLPPAARPAVTQVVKQVRTAMVTLKNGTKRAVYQSTGLPVPGQNSIPQYYNIKKGPLGGWYANVSPLKFKIWARQKFGTTNLNSLPNSLKKEYKNYFNQMQEGKRQGEIQEKTRAELLAQQAGVTLVPNNKSAQNFNKFLKEILNKNYKNAREFSNARNRILESPGYTNFKNKGNNAVRALTNRETATVKKVSMYNKYPNLKRVQNILNKVQNNAKSTGNAQYKILKTPKKTGPFAHLGKYMNNYNWKPLLVNRNIDLTPAQLKTIQKIVASLNIPEFKKQYKNRPPLNFNINRMSTENIRSQAIAYHPPPPARPGAEYNRY